ncbi:MAG: molybdopterin molybdotransferase MoeA [Deltaproteobacteria bacterium]|nr:molybdopterin molybdotransferase MoeA [Deltaproteobacteria bacterium]
MPPILRYDEALARIATLPPLAATEEPPLGEARGRVLAADLVAREDLPPFDNSAMDGFALRSAATARASAASPLRLVVGPTVYAGAPLPEAETSAAGTVRIMTGAPIPAGYDTVLRREDAALETEAGTERLVLRAPVPAGAHVRRRGEDTARGTRLVAAPRVLTPQLLAVAAGQAYDALTVRRSPVLRLVATGDELIEDPHRPLGPGQIRNTSLPFLQGEAARLGLPAVREPLMADRLDEAVALVRAWLPPSATREPGTGLPEPNRTLRGAASADVLQVVISTGAVSVGDRDFVPALVERLGFEVLVHGAYVRPGKPVLVARHPSGAVVWVGLPGNVLSTAAGFRFFALPVLRTLLGLPLVPPRPRARLAADFRKPAELRFFARGALRPEPDGGLTFVAENRQGSGMLTALAGTEGYAVIPEGSARVPAGSLVEAVPDSEGL